MRIGELCARAGVTPRTVRYYESIGLMPPGHRAGSGQHHYTADAVARLDEIGEVIDLYFAEPSAVPAKRKVLTLLRKHLTEVDDKISEVHKLRTDLQRHIERFEDWLRHNER